MAPKQKVKKACCKSNVSWEKKGPALGKSRLSAQLKPWEEGARLGKWSGSLSLAGRFVNLIQTSCRLCDGT